MQLTDSVCLRTLLFFSSSPIQIKVVVVTLFERGEDTGDAPGEFQLWIEREHFDRVDAHGGPQRRVVVRSPASPLARHWSEIFVVERAELKAPLFARQLVESSHALAR